MISVNIRNYLDCLEKYDKSDSNSDEEIFLADRVELLWERLSFSEMRIASKEAAALRDSYKE